MARNPTHYARLSLLLILMAGVGILAASFGGTLKRSFEDRALYATGADIRVEDLLLNSRGSSRPVVASYKEIPGVVEVAPVIRAFGTDLSKLLGELYTMFATDGGGPQRRRMVQRKTFPTSRWGELLTSLEHPDPPRGIRLPEGARAIGVRVKADRPRHTIGIDARIADANDRYFTYRLGTLHSSDWIELEANLVRTARFRRPPLQPVHPLTLVSLSVHEMNPRGTLRAGSIAIDEIRVRMAGAAEPIVIEPFDDISEWSVLKVVPQAVSDKLQESKVAFDGDTGAATFSWSEGGPLISRGIFNGPPISPLPALATRSFLSDTGHSLGEEFDVSVAGHRVPVRLVETVDYFPTLDTLNLDHGFLISDLASLVRYANLDARSSELKANEVWLSTVENGADQKQMINTLEEDEHFSNRENPRQSGRSWPHPRLTRWWTPDGERCSSSLSRRY